MIQPYYQDETATIYHGDCRDIVPMLGVVPDLTVADPPYGQTSLAWDRWPAGWLELDGLGASLWCFGSLRLFMARASEFFADGGWRMSQDVVWEKHNGSSFHADRFKRVHEQAVHFYRGVWGSVYRVPPTTPDATARTVRRKRRPPHTGDIGSHSYVSEDGGPRLMRSVLYARSMHGCAENETQKPETIVSPLIEYACPPRGLILSPFCGSGTDLYVARMTGRRAIGIDVREGQCESAARRLSETLPLEV